MKFELDRFVADLEAALLEESRIALKEVVARAVSDPAAVIRALGGFDKPIGQALFRSPRLTVLNVVWAPNQVTLPHNHLMAAAIGMYGGREDNIFWRRRPDSERFQIEPVGGKALGTGDVALLAPDIVHSVVNPLDRVSGAIHVYDGDFFAVPRSMWDPETLVEQPYDLRSVIKGRSVEE